VRDVSHGLKLKGNSRINNSHEVRHGHVSHLKGVMSLSEILGDDRLVSARTDEAVMSTVDRVRAVGRLIVRTDSHRVLLHTLLEGTVHARHELSDQAVGVEGILLELI